MTHRIGFSTGATFGFRDPLSITGIQDMPMGGQPPNPVEICFNNTNDLPAFRNLAIDLAQNEAALKMLSSSVALSIHAPANGVRYGDNEISEAVLDAVWKMMQVVRIDRVVFHPDVIDHDGWELFRYGRFPGLALENSDSRKPFGRSVDDMAELIDRLRCGLVLDLAHCFMIDPTMRSAYDFIDRLGDRIVEVHLSGVGESEGSHVPLFKTGQDIILDPLRLIPTDIPVIVESACAGSDDLEAEYRYISRLLP
ncbi:MAG: hypothetical protein HGA31_01885 [Candidatus Moranbacteria bacterium]|nr:hypothetical protein [Candidatus Moranbacteria bacterium]